MTALGIETLGLREVELRLQIDSYQV